jgi:hypothetical protein
VVTVSLTWDDLPGDSASHIADLEENVDRIVHQLDRASNDNIETGYELADLRQDVQILRDYLIRVEGELTR